MTTSTSTTPIHSNSLPLSGIKILDFSRMLPGPYCSMLLADLGADVICVEDPQFFFSRPFPVYQNSSESGFSAILMRNKRSIALNMKKTAARDLIYKIVKQTDVVLETFRPGVMDKLQCGYNQLRTINPHLIYAALTGYGQTGPYRDIPGHDLNYIGLTGSLALNSDQIPHSPAQRKPIVPGVQAGDIGGAMMSSIGILSALYYRDRSPDRPGQYIDIAMTDCVFYMNPMASAFALTKVPLSQNILHGEYPFYNTYETKDGKWLSIGAIEPKFWETLCDALEAPDLKLKQFAEGENRRQVFTQLMEIFHSRTRQEWTQHFLKYDTCVMPIYDMPEAFADPQIRARGLITEFNHPRLGQIEMLANPIKFSAHTLSIHRPAPRVGEDTTAILQEFGYSPEEITELKRQGVFR